jgi:hypothetical protein
MLTFIEKIKLQDSKLVLLYQGKNKQGRAFFAYFLCDAAQVRLMREDVAAGNSRVISEYGEMLYSDYLPEPDENATIFLREWAEENGGSVVAS